MDFEEWNHRFIFLSNRPMTSVLTASVSSPTKLTSWAAPAIVVFGTGGCGIVASQLSHEISFSKVSYVTTIGLDQAGLHIDNLDAHTDTLCDENNCTKAWHHNWVHDARDKCARGDDGTVDLSFHHNVVFNCGGAPGP